MCVSGVCTEQHDSEEVRWTVQGHLPGDLRERVRGSVQGEEDLVRAQTYWYVHLLPFPRRFAIALRGRLT